MWYERYVIIVTSRWRRISAFLVGLFHHPELVGDLTFAGTFGIFLSLFLPFMRYLPMVAMSEVKLVTPEADPHALVPDSHDGRRGPQRRRSRTPPPVPPPTESASHH